MDSAKYVRPFEVLNCIIPKDAGSFEKPSPCLRDCSKAGTDICAILTCWLAWTYLSSKVATMPVFRCYVSAELATAVNKQ